MPDVTETDDHTTHIYTHNMIPPGKRTWSMWVHIFAHEQALAEQKQQEMMAQQLALQQESQVVDNAQGKTSKINVGKEKRSPMAATTSIKNETKAKDSIK